MLTVILPSLNVVQYIGQCLDSVINQTYKELDIICVDAGSTDGTLEVIEQYADIDKRIRIINCEKKSYGIQVNMAMDIAYGKYIAIVDTDDFISLDMYSKLVMVAEKNNLDYIKANYTEYYQFNNNKVYEHRKSIISESKWYNHVINPKEFPQLHCQDGYLWCGIYNIDFIKINGIRFNTTSGAAFQDVGFFHQVTYHANRVMFTDIDGYYYRILRDGNSISSPNGLKYMLQEYKRLIDEKLIPIDDKLQWTYIYKKMILSFVAECDKDIIYNSFKNDSINLYLEEAVNLMQESFKYLKMMDFNETYWEKVQLLITDKNKFAQQQSKKAQAIKCLINKCEVHINISQDAQIVVFGCGIRGKRIAELLMKHGIHFSAFVDNDVRKTGKTIDGVNVTTLKSNITKNVLYLISIKNHEDDIKNQLLSNGIPINNIYVPDCYIWI